ncbi:MAG: hydrolase family protein, partial [Phenylobacterium sp.]|nr:hydrolase family protein [Phenylobacterium sp.]
MKLATLTVDEGAPEVGVAVGDEIVRLKSARPQLPDTLIELIAAWDEVRPQIDELVASPGHRMPLAEVRLLAPIPRPGKIMAMGLNYADHVAEAK